MDPLSVTAVTPSVMRVCLFGGAHVEAADGEEIRLTPYQLALVATVYGHGAKGLNRLSAARLLWGVRAATKGRQGIRQLLHDLRVRVGGRIIDTPLDVLRPAPGVTSEFAELERGLLEGRLHEAARLVSRGFIADPIISADSFDDWRSSLQARLRRKVQTRASLAWSSAVDEGDWRRARDAAEALYSLDPADPRAAERVIEARGRSGLLGEARAAFEEYLGTIPSGSKPAGAVSETMDRVHATARIKARTRQPTRPELPFVGRRRALSTARASLEQVAANGFRLVLISGESGIGKTRLLDQVHGEAIMRGFRCLRAQPVELEQSIPLNPILDCLTGIDLRSHLEAIGSPWNSVIAGLLPPGTFEDPLENPPPIRPSSLSRRLLDSFALLFERLAREQPTVLLLDDLQWADATTVATLQFLQRRWTGGSMGIFATLRPELVRVTDPLAKYLTGAGGLPAKRIELTSLATSEAIELVDAIADGEISERHANRLCAIAGHHPLYLTELTREFLAGRLVLPDLPGDQVTIPPSLEHMLDARLESMDSDAMTVAGLLAVAARPLKVPVIAELTGIGLQHVAAAVEALQRGRFVVVAGESVRIAHELFRSAVYRHLSGPRRALHHRAIAARLLSESPNESSGELAVHFARAGQDDLAASHGWSAARRAMDAGAIAEAVELFEIVSERDREPARRAEATAELARALVLSRDISRANPALGRAAEQLRSTGKADVARRLEIERIGGLAELAEASLGELLVGLGAIKAEAREAHDWETVAQALDVELHLLHRSGAVEAIRGVLEEMREVALKDQREARLLSKAGLALGVFFDDPEEALRAAEEAVDLAGDERRYRLHALVRLIIVLHAGGRLSRPEAVAVTSEASALAARCGDVLQQYAIESNVAAALLDAGDLEQAEAKMVGSATGQYSGEMALQRFIRKNNHAELAVARGDFATAQHAYLDAATHLGPTTPTYMRDLLNAGLGYCAIETGDLGEARRREDMLHEPPSSWYFDPTTLLAFRTRMLERRQRWQEATTVLDLAASDLQHRLVLAWFKLRLLQARILAKHGDRSATDVADQALQRARELQLSHREREFAAVLDSLR